MRSPIKVHLVRLVDKDLNVVCTGRIMQVTHYSNRSVGELASNRIGHIVVDHAEIDKPLWYGGTYKHPGPSYFTIPSGHENIWGCGNDFDVDSFRIHPDDLITLENDLEERDINVVG